MEPIVIYRSFYGQLSETFVRDHVHGLRRFLPFVLANRLDPRGPASSAQTTVVPNHGKLSGPLWHAGLAWQAHRLLRKISPRLIHAHFLIDGVSILPYAKRLNIPLVVTAHGYDATLRPEALAESSEGRLLLARQKALMRDAAMILCVSDFIRDELLARGYPDEKLVLQYLGVDIRAIHPQIGGARRGVLTVGRLVEKKGTRLLIEAYARLPESLRAEHPLKVIGDGTLRRELEALANELGVAVDFLGAQPRNRIFEELLNTATFCLPSVRAASGDAEGMPIAIMEALATATPTLIFDDQPAAALLRSSGAGVLARAGSSADLAIQLGAMLQSDEAALMGKRGRALAERQFDISINNAQLEDRYTDVIERNRAK